ncbi:MurR/RpiR family transcriptional regulator [Enterococcus sp. LJL120]
MKIIARIDVMKEQYTKVEKKIADFLTENIFEIPKMTASEIGDAAEVSAATVIRFIKKIGYHGLPDFKLAILAEESAETSSGYDDIAFGEPFHLMSKKMLNNAKLALDESNDLQDEKKIMAIVQQLEEVDTCFVFGVGASSIIAEDIKQKWTRIGKSMIFERDVHVLLPQLINRKNIALWLVSNSGETKDILHLAKTAREVHVPVISLTQIGTNSLAKLSDLQLATSVPKETAFRSAATNSLFTQLFLVDILFYSYISKNPSYAQQIYASRGLIKKYGR